MPSGARGGEPDVYTVLTLIALLFALGATLYVGTRMVATFGTLLPPGGS